MFRLVSMESSSGCAFKKVLYRNDNVLLSTRSRITFFKQSYPLQSCVPSHTLTSGTIFRDTVLLQFLSQHVCKMISYAAWGFEYRISADRLPEDGIHTCRNASEQKLVYNLLHTV